MFSMRLKRRQRPLTSPLASGALILASVAAALVVSAIPVSLVGVNPLAAYQAMLAGAFGSVDGIVDVVMRATPLLLSGLGTAIAFRGGQWNIGGEGQIYFGALGATLVGLGFAGLPVWIHLPLACLGGFAGGALWALLPAALKVWRGMNEIISTLMLNYIATFIIRYLVKGPLQGASAFMPQTAVIAPAAHLPLLMPPWRLHAGTLLALLMAVAVFVLLDRTSLGYNFRALGFNPQAARYGGVRVPANIVLIMLISGGLSGLAGSNEVLGMHFRLFDGISPGYAFTGIIVALLGRLNPIGMIASSIMFSGLIVGANDMQRVVGIPTAIAGIIQGVVVLFVLGTEILLEYRPAITRSRPKDSHVTGKAQDVAANLH